MKGMEEGKEKREGRGKEKGRTGIDRVKVCASHSTQDR